MLQRLRGMFMPPPPTTELTIRRDSIGETRGISPCETLIGLMQDHLQHGVTINYPLGTPRYGHNHTFAVLRSKAYETLVTVASYDRPFSEEEQRELQEEELDLRSAKSIYVVWIHERTGDTGMIAIHDSEEPIGGIRQQLDPTELALAKENWYKGQAPDYLPPKRESRGTLISNNDPTIPLVIAVLQTAQIDSNLMKIAETWLYKRSAQEKKEIVDAD